MQIFGSLEFMVMGLAYVNLKKNVHFLKRTPIAKERYFSMKPYLPDLVAKYLQLRGKHDGVLVASLSYGTHQWRHVSAKTFQIAGNSIFVQHLVQTSPNQSSALLVLCVRGNHRWPLVPNKKARYTESVPTSSCILPQWRRGTPYGNTWEPVWMF